MYLSLIGLDKDMGMSLRATVPAGSSMCALIFCVCLSVHLHLSCVLRLCERPGKFSVPLVQYKK